MARRKAYTRVVRLDHVRPEFVRGMGDVAFKGFNCPAPDCREWLFVRSLDVKGSFDIECPHCHQYFSSGDVVTLFQYDLQDTGTGLSIERGNFELLLDDYLDEAEEYKYCILCCNLKPLSMFDRHASRQTGRQGECTLCKRTYNAIKNQTRLADQHREAAQKRRLYVELGVTEKVNSAVVRARFGDRCFKCGRDVKTHGAALDHTLPVFYLWPLTTDTATLLCSNCNGIKAGSWPAAFYSNKELHALAALTGLEYELLAGDPQFNPAALGRLQDPAFVDAMIVKYAAYMDELIRLRNRLLRLTGLDFFAVATKLSPRWVSQADTLLRAT